MSSATVKRFAIVALAASLFAASLFAASPALHAQGYPFSQRGTVTQKIAFTEIKLEYGRPTARGRKSFAALRMS